MLTIIENVLAQEEVKQLRSHLNTAQWCDGKETAGTLSESVKTNQQLKGDSDLAISLGNHIVKALGNHPLFVSAALPHKIYPPKFNRYLDGGEYGTHVDSAIMHVDDHNLSIRADVSATVFLCNPNDYEGGELEIETPFGAQAIKLNAGDMVLYPSSSLHKVNPVTKGERTCAFLWVQSMIQDEGQRTLLFDLDQSIQSLTAASPNNPELLRLTGVYHNLLRRWAVV